MGITDAWLNPLIPGSVSTLGYRVDLDTFPHDLYSFYLSTIRDEDIANVRLLWRWLQGMQREWEIIYGKILNLPTLYSPDDCPEELLQYLRHNIGITDDLDYLWQELSINEQRRLIKYFVFFISIRSTAYGIEKTIENMTGDEVEIYDFFNYRWLLSGDSEYEMEAAIGREDLSSDMWMLSDVDMPCGVIPDDVALVTVGGAERYEFTISTLIAVTLATEPPVPPFVRLTYRSTRQSVIAAIYYDGVDYKARTLGGDYLGQLAVPYSVDVNDFRVGFDSDPYVFDVRVVDDGSVNRDLLKAIIRFERPMSERVYLRYYNMIEKFESLDLWTEDAGTITLDEDETTVTLADAAVDSIIHTNVDGADDWTDYSLSVKAQCARASKYFEMRFFYQDALNYMYFRVEAGVPPILPAGTWRLGKVVAGVDTAVSTGNLDWFDLNVDYFWRMSCVESGSNLVIHLFQDEILLSTDTLVTPWATPKGDIELVGEASGVTIVSYMDVHPVPMESDFVGP